MAKYALGTRVQIIHTSPKYRSIPVGTMGCVCSNYNDMSIGLELDGLWNKNSEYGYFYFEERQIKAVNEEEHTMSIVKEAYSIVTVKFEDGGMPNTRFACYIPDIDRGDYVLVQTRNHGKAVATIEEVVEPVTRAEPLAREVICRVDMTDYMKRKADRRRAAELFEQMNQRAKELQTTALFEMMAKNDPAMQEMLDEYYKIAK